MRVLNKLLRNWGTTRFISYQILRQYSASAGYLREAYHCNDAWAKRLDSSILKKVNPDDLFFEMDQKYAADKVLSAIDVDIFVNKVSGEEALEEVEELAHRLRKSPATADSLPSTSHAIIRAFLNEGKTDDLIRILNDRMNYGVFIDNHTANILMDEFIKKENYRDAAKVASLLMLEEDFGTPTTKLFCLISCLKYLKEPKPEPWNTPVEETKEEVKVRMKYLRNPYYDEHFDLTKANQIVGKTLAMVGKELTEDDVLSRSVQLLGWGVYGKWEKVESLLQSFVSSKKPIAEESLKTVSELVEKALADLEASPTKTLPKPKISQFPGMNLEEKEVAAFWEKVKYPDYSKILPSVKSTLTSQLQVTKDDLISKSENLLSVALSQYEEKEIAEQTKTYETWEKNRIEELQRQIQRFKAHKIVEDIEAKKKELQDKEEVIFFFDNQEEWMMKLPLEEQGGYKLSTEYKPTNQTKFVKVIPPKKIRKRKSKV